MKNRARSGVFRLANVQSAIPGPAGEHTVSIFQRGTLSAMLALSPAERPSPLARHQQDELYVIVRGRGVLFHDGKRDPFESGDLLFVAAGTEHRFEDFSDDLAVWVLFYGLLGGEVSA